ncbi:response regulator [Pedobacter heparinus]|uniref:response regulator n=1 Tax=Pedobacter heparinus TaxID=984 RepID=UPI00292E6C64|nr:response regulator [Pedobacter heparinus]
MHCITGFVAAIVISECYVLWFSPVSATGYIFALSLTAGMVAAILAFSIKASLKKGIADIVTGAGEIKNGALKTRVDAYAKHEINILAWAFNELAVKLEHQANEVERISVSLAQEQERAAHYEKVKQYFLVNMSHEIRTPMNAILGFARHLQESLKEKEQVESIKMIIKSGDHLLVTLNDILDFANIETGEISFVCLPFNLRDTIQSICMLMESNARLKEIGLSYTIDPDIPDAIYGDSVRLTQILLSLTSNAVKFTEKGGVSISARAIADHDDHVIIEFRVKDTGIGIPPDKQEKIFNPFEQGTNHMKRKFGGTGIGLSIVKHLIALQDGIIQLKSMPDEGSEFYFRLSFLKAHAGKSWEQSAHNALSLTQESEIGRGVNVLIVEDNAINQLLVIKLLQKKGYHTTVAENGKIALHKYANTDFDIILMDLQMPEMDGYETAIHIRSMKSDKKHVPIVAMTAHTIKGEREKCLSIGMDDYISKPFHASELYEKIQLLVKKQTLALNVQADVIAMKAQANQ